MTGKFIPNISESREHIWNSIPCGGEKCKSIRVTSVVTCAVHVHMSCLHRERELAVLLKKLSPGWTSLPKNLTRYIHHVHLLCMKQCTCSMCVYLLSAVEICYCSSNSGVEVLLRR